jgi:hypothetical protein
VTYRIRSAIFFLVVLAGAGLPSPAAAQSVVDDRLWLTVTLQEQGTDDSPWRWSFETILRSRDGVDALDVFTIRPTAIYQIAPKWSLGGGYALAQTFPAPGSRTVEHRLFGQAVFTTALAGGSLSLRTRVESRMFKGNSGPLGRVREQVRFTRPFAPGSRLAVALWDEILVHTNDTTRTPKGVDQNRVFAGVQVTMRSAVRIEAGYLNQFSPGHRGAANRMNHILATSVAIGF